jgi:hypothetical protein
MQRLILVSVIQYQYTVLLLQPYYGGFKNALHMETGAAKRLAAVGRRDFISFFR